MIYPTTIFGWIIGLERAKAQKYKKRENSYILIRRKKQPQELLFIALKTNVIFTACNKLLFSHSHRFHIYLYIH